MSVDIKIQQKGLFKKKLSLTDILMDSFCYGRYDDNYILREGEMSESEMTIYHPDHIARGISVIWNAQETHEIGLQMLLPTTNDEINDLYLIIEHICHLWHTNQFIQDDQVYTLQDISKLKQNIKDFNYQTLHNFLSDHESGWFFCAMWPIYFESKKSQHWLQDKSLKHFSEDLHMNQKQDLYYANARFYQMDKEDGTQFIMGIYTVTATVDTIFPTEPIIPFSCMNLQTGERIEAKEYRVGLVSLVEDKMLGSVRFDDFMRVISENELIEFDAKHICLPALSEQQILDIYNQYAVD